MTTAVQRRGWGLVKKDQKLDRERARAIRARQRSIGRELRRMFDDVRKIDRQESNGENGQS